MHINTHFFLQKLNFGFFQTFKSSNTFTFLSLWGPYISFIAKTASKKIGALIRSMKILSPEVALYL